MTLDINSLESAASGWEWAGYVASALVLVGVVLESLEIISGIKSGHWRTKRIETFAILILVSGLALEILAEAQSNRATGLIEALLNGEAQAAERDAAKANETTAILRLQENPRTLTDDEAVSLVDLTWNFVGQKFVVAISSRDAETAEFARSILINLDAAGWNSSNEKSPDLLPILTVGVIVVLNQHELATDETTSSAKILAKFLYDHGFAQTIGPEYDSDWARLGSISIIVGGKILPQPDDQAN